MKNKISKIFALILVLGLLVCSLSACSNANGGGVPAEYSVNVTYYLSGGEFDGYAGKKYINIYYLPDSKIAEPNVSSTALTCKLKGHSLSGWFIAEKDGEGKVITDEEGNPKASSEMFDFSRKVSEDLTLIAYWTRSIRLIYNNYYMAGTTLVRSDCSGGGAINRPTLECTDSSGNVREIEGFYWHYDEATDTYSDEITFPLSYEHLNSLLSEEIEPDPATNFITMYAFVKYKD